MSARAWRRARPRSSGRGSVLLVAALLAVLLLPPVQVPGASDAPAAAAPVLQVSGSGRPAVGPPLPLAPGPPTVTPPAPAEPSPGDVVSAAVAAYGGAGTLAVALARLQPPTDGLTLRAAEARTARALAGWADNGLAARPFPTASLVKLFVAEGVLHRARTGQVTLTPRDLGVLRVMISESDDPAASELWVRFDGERMVRDVAARYGLTGTAPPRVQGKWGEATTTAGDLARFLTRLPVVAHPEDAGTLLSWMRAATPIAADGFDQRFGAFGTLPGTPAVKQGWMCCVGGARHLHSVAVQGDRVLVLLSEVPRATGYGPAGAALSAAAAAAAPSLPG